MTTDTIDILDRALRDKNSDEIGAIHNFLPHREPGAWLADLLSQGSWLAEALGDDYNTVSDLLSRVYDMRLLDEQNGAEDRADIAEAQRGDY
jgi:hypothetical protein